MRAHFNHIALYVAGLETSAAFYHDVVGAEVIADPFRDGKHLWFKIAEHDQLHLISGKAPPKVDNDMHFAFSVPSLDDFVTELRTLGITYNDGTGGVNKVRLRPDGVKQIYFQDPDGYWIEANEDRY
jgi:lactoylglutathione lyase